MAAVANPLLTSEGQTPEELVDLKHAGFDLCACLVALPQTDNLSFGDGRSEAHALDYPCAGP